MTKDSINTLLGFCKGQIFCYLGIKYPVELEKGEEKLLSIFSHQEEAKIQGNQASSYKTKLTCWMSAKSFCFPLLTV